MLCIKIPENISLQSITEIYVHFYKTLLKGCENITIKTTKKWYKKMTEQLEKRKAVFIKKGWFVFWCLACPPIAFLYVLFADSAEV